MSIKNTTYHICILLVLVMMTACIKREVGCTDPTALNFNPDAFIADTCIFELSTPAQYTFSRVGQSTVDYSEPIVQQLLIQDIPLMIQGLANQSIDTASVFQLDSRFAETAPLFSILTTTSPSPVVTNYNTINPTARSLSAEMSNQFGDRSLFQAAIDTISNRAYEQGITGTALYTDENIDLSSMLYHGLLTSVCYQEGIQLVENIFSSNNSTNVTSQSYTAREHDWDLAFGYLGMPAFWGAWDIGDIANNEQLYKDSSGDGQIDFTFEYAFPLMQMAAERDEVNRALGEPLFTDSLFIYFLEGRTAITSKKDTLSHFVERLSFTWEKASAANAVHYINAVKNDMMNLQSTQDTTSLNTNWIAMKMWLQGLAYKGNTLFEEYENVLLQVGTSPVYANLGTPEFNDYLMQLEGINVYIQSLYGFSEAQMMDF